MTVRAVRQLGDPVLRMAANAVADPADPQVASLITDLSDTLHHWRGSPRRRSECCSGSCFWILASRGH